ncbi:hypothetical protein BGZ65_009495, partial [Modicella reniformis]
MSLWPGIRSETRYYNWLREYRSATNVGEGRSRWDGSNLDGMWGNPGDYLADGQVDESYEGLLRLGEQIGDVKPKGVPAHVMRRMDKHIVSWKRMKDRNVTLTTPMEAHQDDMKQFIDLRQEWNNNNNSSSSSSSSSNNNHNMAAAAAALSSSMTTTRPITRSYASRKDAKDSGSAEDITEENCTICLQVYDMSDQLRPLPCKHSFHVDCIDTWLRSNAQCPICRQEVNAVS